MGTYECIASNGISPDAVYEFPVEVHCKIFNLKFIEKCFNWIFSVKPLVSIVHVTEQIKTVKPGDNVSLYCGVS